MNCLRCGQFRYELEAITVYGNNFSDDNRLIISSKINESSKKNYVFKDSDIERFLTGSAPTVAQRADYLLKCFAKYYPQIGAGPSMSNIEEILTKGKNIDEVDFKNPFTKFVLQSLSRSYSSNRKELEYLIRDYHINGTAFITLVNNDKLEVSPKGWARLDELKYVSQESNIGFIAMKFLPKLIEFSEKWFEGGIKDAGYEAKAMYSHKHNRIIDNEMLALIRRSKFLVCDLTNSSKGAYYEAGFAHGLKIPVIFLCEKNFFHNKKNELSVDKEGVHFDTNHYPIIFWEYGDDNGKELKKELKDWIESTVGRGLLEEKV